MSDWTRAAAQEMAELRARCMAEGVPPQPTTITTAGEGGTTTSAGNAYVMGITVADEPEIDYRPWRTLTLSQVRQRHFMLIEFIPGEDGIVLTQTVDKEAKK